MPTGGSERPGPSLSEDRPGGNVTAPTTPAQPMSGTVAPSRVGPHRWSKDSRAACWKDCRTLRGATNTGCVAGPTGQPPKDGGIGRGVSRRQKTGTRPGGYRVSRFPVRA